MHVYTHSDLTVIGNGPYDLLISSTKAFCKQGFSKPDLSIWAHTMYKRLLGTTKGNYRFWLLHVPISLQNTPDHKKQYQPNPVQERKKAETLIETQSLINKDRGKKQVQRDEKTIIGQKTENESTLH